MRKNILLIIAVSLISLCGILYATSRFTLLADLAEIEENYTHQNVERALGALSYIISDLEAETLDWAVWDDTYAFIEDANNEYIQSNLGNETFINLRLNLMLFIHSSGQVVFGKAFDLDNEEEIAIPQKVKTHLSENGLFSSQPGTESSTSGIILLDKGPMLIASQPILTSEYKGPARGIVILGHYLDSAVINRLTQVTLYPLTICPIDDARMRPDFQKALSSLSGEAPIFVQLLNTQYAAGYTLIADIYGKPVLALRVEVPRDIYLRGQVGVAYHILLILGIGLLVAVAAMFFMQKKILSRFTSLIKGIEHITKSGDISTRLPVTGNDELTVVAGTINGMLAELQQSEDKLKELYQHEKALRQEVEAEMLKRIEFTRALVHELKTPITPVLASSELLVEELKDKPLVSLAENIKRGASNLNRRINELLDLAKSEIGTLQVIPMSVDTMQLLTNIVNDVMPLTSLYKQKMDIELPSSLPAVWADPERFHQVVLNLLNNALKFNAPGETVTLRAREEGGELIVEVQDTGRGISKREQQRIFEPYHRTEGDRGRLSGLGLGLALSKKLVELHGGQIWVKSRLGEGSTFGFSLPLVAASEREENVKREGES